MNQTPGTATLEPHVRTEGNEEARPRRSLAEPVSANITDAEKVIMSAPAPDIHIHKNQKPDDEALEESTSRAEELIGEANKKWGQSTSAQSIAWDPKTCNLFACDDLGTLRCFNIRKVIADIGMIDAALVGIEGGSEGGEGEGDEGEGESKAEQESVLSSLNMDFGDGGGDGGGGDGDNDGAVNGSRSKKDDEDEDQGSIIGRRYIKGICAPHQNGF